MQVLVLRAKRFRPTRCEFADALWLFLVHHKFQRRLSGGDRQCSMRKRRAMSPLLSDVHVRGCSRRFLRSRGSDAGEHRAAHFARVAPKIGHETFDRFSVLFVGSGDEDDVVDEARE